MGHGETAHAPGSEAGPHGSPPFAASTEMVRVRAALPPPHETGHAFQLQRHAQGRERVYTWIYQPTHLHAICPPRPKRHNVERQKAQGSDVWGRFAVF
jgi:hypothetical protein